MKSKPAKFAVSLVVLLQGCGSESGASVISSTSAPQGSTPVPQSSASTSSPAASPSGLGSGLTSSAPTVSVGVPSAPAASMPAPSATQTATGTSSALPSNSGPTTEPSTAASPTSPGTAEPTATATSTGPLPTASSSSGTDPDPTLFAAGFNELFIHDACTGDNPSQPDTCLHEQLHEEMFTFGGDPAVTYQVELRVRGLFEPTHVEGGTTPYADSPFYRVGGQVTAPDYSQWQIVIGEPAVTYTLNHYPNTSHTIYQEDFEVTIPVQGGSEVSVRVQDGNERQINNGATGIADRQQTIDGVTAEVLDGQVLRLDVLGVTVD